MNCTDFLAKLTDYFDGQIDPDLLVEVKEHLGTVAKQLGDEITIRHFVRFQVGEAAAVV